MPLIDQIAHSAKEGNSDEVVRLASQSNPFSVSSSLVETALLTACEFGHLSVVRSCILDLKCNPNCVDKSGRSPLHMAVLRKENGKVAVSIVKFLCSKGAKIRKSVLHVCSNDLVVQPLLELKADVNARSVDNLTPIAAAVAADKQEVVMELIRGNCKLIDDLIFLAKSACVTKELVRAKVDINFRNSKGITALQQVVEANDKRLARCLLEAKADPTMVSRTPSVEDSSASSSVTVSRSNSIALSLMPDNNFKGLIARLEEISKIISKSATSDNLDDMLSVDVEDWLEAESLLANASRDIQAIKEKIELRNKSMSTSSVCVVCKVRVKSVVLMPCKHLCCCSVCAKALQKGGTWDTSVPDAKICKPQCPLCRSPFLEAVNVFT